MFFLKSEKNEKYVFSNTGLRIGGHPALSLHSSNEPGELSQWLWYDDTTINIAVVTIIIPQVV